KPITLTMKPTPGMHAVFSDPAKNQLSSYLCVWFGFRVLQHFNTSNEEYAVVFTSGATAALKLVAETFPWTRDIGQNLDSVFCYLTDNHTSVVGMRVVATAFGASCIPVRPEDIEKLSIAHCDDGQKINTHHLFCFPAQSNFTGRKYPLNWVQAVQENRFIWGLPPGCWHVLLDAASFVGTSPLDLAQYPADLVTISFYKIFGFPTGLGALLVRQPCWSLLQKAYFGGGTVAAYLPSHDFCVPPPSINSLGCILSGLGVENFAKLYGIQLRTGCFCNTGTCQAQLGLSDCDIKTNLEAGHVCGDLVDLVNGRPTGAVRISLGYMSTCEDVHAFLDFVVNCFVKRSQLAGVVFPTLPNTRPFESNDLDASQTETSLPFEKPQRNTRPILTNIFVYPIKSCAPIEVFYFPQKSCTPHCTLVFFLSHLLFSLAISGANQACVYSQAMPPRLIIVQPGLKVAWKDCGKEAADWLSEFLGRSYRLVQQDQNSDRAVGSLPCNLSLANEAQYLLLNRASVIQSPQKGFTVKTLLSRFRGNFIIDKVPAFEEDSWKAVDIGSFKFLIRTPIGQTHMMEHRVPAFQNK
uniref:Molybdenum cofactor sulfurase n=1 Tax=Eptatretus burgeri TaxID=7764 RepID=A0A8C4NFF3_EPTBU